jgi:hypothetical protein
MAKDIIIDNVSDEALVRVWEAVMEQVAKEYIDLYIKYLKYGPGTTAKLSWSRKVVYVKPALIELEDYILGDLIAGPHAQYIVHGLREEARKHVEDGRKRRKEIIRRG